MRGKKNEGCGGNGTWDHSEKVKKVPGEKFLRNRNYGAGAHTKTEETSVTSSLKLPFLTLALAFRPALAVVLYVLLQIIHHTKFMKSS